MKFSEKTLTTLEFDKIKQLLSKHALTQGAKELANSLVPCEHISVILRNLRHTTDAVKLLNSKGMPSFGMIQEMASICDRANKGATLTTRELLDSANVMRTSRSLLDYIRTNKLFETSLDEIFERLMPDRKFEEKIYRAIISEDIIADEASSTLSDIRRKKKNVNVHIKDLLSKYTGGTYSKYLQDNIVTQRGGRYVVPVKVEYKNEIKGLVHDTSASGATVFIEPISVVDANNELRGLEAAEQYEINKILSELSNDVSSVSSALYMNYQNITELAFIFARGEFSICIDGVQPQISGDRSMNLVKARHPLIEKSKVVPIDICMRSGCDTIIITGPNTGGKTVTLKTIGLFALMTQAGLHIPVEEQSSICVFDDILADIGDEQSIEQSLSTFSSHMVNIVDIIDKVTDRSLVLFDELGVGTDPIEGAALAVSIIECVRERGAMCAATTHYAELKAYALDTDGVENASCEFDIETLCPTYKLVIGTPGKSNAFAISSRLGLPINIIERAQRAISSDNKRFEDVIEKLEINRIEMEKNREAATQLRNEYEKFKTEAEKKINEKLRLAERELEKAQAKALSIVESAKASSDFVLSQLEKAKKAKESEHFGKTLEQARREIRSYLRENEDKYNPIDSCNEDEVVALPRPLKKGDKVYLRNIGTCAVVLSLPDKSGNISVQAGAARTKTNITNIKLVDENEIMVTDKENRSIPASEYKPKVIKEFSPEIDLRGMTGEEAWYAVDKYIDDAQIYSVRSVRLIHGKGTGALKNALWQFLRSDKRVASYRIGRYGEGDGGVTVLELK